MFQRIAASEKGGTASRRPRPATMFPDQNSTVRVSSR